jgi:hypothetical protein
MGNHHTKTASRQGAVQASPWQAPLVAALLLCAQFSLFLHFIVCPHVLPPVTGHAAHLSNASACQADRTNQSPAKPAEGNHHDECRVFTVLTQAAVIPFLSWLPVSGAPVGEGMGVPVLTQPSPRQGSLIRLSPSHSPPAVA